MESKSTVIAHDVFKNERWPERNVFRPTRTVEVGPGGGGGGVHAEVAACRGCPCSPLGSEGAGVGPVPQAPWAGSLLTQHLGCDGTFLIFFTIIHCIHR